MSSPIFDPADFPKPQRAAAAPTRRPPTAAASPPRLTANTTWPTRHDRILFRTAAYVMAITGVLIICSYGCSAVALMQMNQAANDFNKQMQQHSRPKK